MVEIYEMTSDSLRDLGGKQKYPFFVYARQKTSFNSLLDRSLSFL